MVADNPPMDLELSHRMTRFRCAMSDGKLRDTWDKAYQWRAKKFPCVVICKNVLGFLGWNAPTVSNADLISVFGKVPGTQNPGRQPLRLLNCLLSQLKVGPLEL